MNDPGSNPYRIAIHYLRQAIHQADDPRRHEELLRAMEVLARRAVAAERGYPNVPNSVTSGGRSGVPRG